MGGQSSSGGTQRVEPPKYQLPYLQDSLREAQSLYQSTNPTVAPQNGSTIDALRGIADRARGGSPINTAASGLAVNTMNGGFLGSNPFLQDSNPHLDATFNRAALATQNQLASQFAGSGRNVEASEGLRSQQLNDLATSIYGGAYEGDQNRRLSAYQGERGLQQSTLGMSPLLGQAQYSDLDRLLGVGQMQEGYHQRDLDAQGNRLDDYIGRISGNMGSTTRITQPGGFSGSGAMGGAMLGNQMYPGVGGILGGLLGGFF